MPGALADRVKETSTSSGTGDFTLAGAVTGYQTFNAAIGQNNNFYYCIEAVNASGTPTGDWEVGQGYLSAATTLVRAYVEYSSNSNNAVDFASATTKNVFNPIPGTEAMATVNNMFSLTMGMP